MIEVRAVNLYQVAERGRTAGDDGDSHGNGRARTVMRQMQSVRPNTAANDDRTRRFVNRVGRRIERV